MAKKKNLKGDDLIGMYMDYVLNHNENPKSVYAFAKANNFEEPIFYKYFGNFEALEQQVFEAFFNQTIELLEKNDDYNSFDSRNKLLSFYFTFFELLTANRSYVSHALKNKSNIKIIKPLIKLKKVFADYIETLEIEKIDLKQKQIEDIQDKSIKEGAWLQLIMTLKFWLDDTSASFEKTDIFIEKAVNTSFDLIGVQPIKSIIDLGKFLFKEKMMMK
jgi:AcrR family transcriptional regulator